MLKLLLVDDEPTIRRGIRESIDWNSRGVTIVGEAGNGVQAMELVRAQRPDVVLVDIVMPRMDGLAFCEECRRTYPNVRLVIVSGHDEFALAQKAIRIGVDDYLLKPVGAEQMMEAVQKAGRSLVKQEFSEIKEKLLRSLVTPAVPSSSSGRRIVSQVLAHIESRYLSELDLTSAGQAAGVTPNHLCKVLRSCCDMTFVEIVNRYRVEVAQIYLRDDHMKTYDVADKSGFMEYHYFAKVFKKITGRTPGEYRELLNGPTINQDTN
jgi:two-component system response regulator YesN